MPSPRCVIESRTRPILPVAVVAAVAALEAAKSSTRHESRCFLRTELAGGALRVENDAAGYRARTGVLGDEHARALVRIDAELKTALGFPAAASGAKTKKAPRVRKPWAKAPPTTRQERFAKRQLLSRALS